MRSETQAALNQINRDFYRLHAASFSSTRETPWRGWSKLMEGEGSPNRILDLGCGNGRFAVFLNETYGQADPHAFVGTDLSPALLSTARERAPAAHFVCHDLLGTQPRSLFTGQFDLIVAFGVLHHIPGFSARVELLRSATELLEPGGSVVFTFWQFGGDPRFKKRTLSWSDSPVPIDVSDLECGDHLLQWGSSGEPTAARYCHYTAPDEALELAEAAELRVAETFLDDGRDRDLNLYVRFRRS